MISFPRPTAIHMVKQLVAYHEKMGIKPRVHPNGFIQLDLNIVGSIRLHVWPAEKIAAQKTHHPIHDHPFEMHSTVLVGTMRNIEYEIADPEIDGAIDGEFLMHRVVRLHESLSTLLEPVGTPVQLFETTDDYIYAGNWYYMHARVLHDSQPQGPTATLMTKVKPDVEYRPLVAVPVGVAPDNDHRREDYDPAQLYRLIYQTLR